MSKSKNFKVTVGMCAKSGTVRVDDPETLKKTYQTDPYCRCPMQTSKVLKGDAIFCKRCHKRLNQQAEYNLKKESNEWRGNATDS